MSVLKQMLAGGSGAGGLGTRGTRGKHARGGDDDDDEYDDERGGTENATTEATSEGETETETETKTKTLAAVEESVDVVDGDEDVDDPNRTLKILAIVLGVVLFAWLVYHLVNTHAENVEHFPVLLRGPIRGFR